MSSTVRDEASSRKHRNWWKIVAIVALIALEVVRELWVIDHSNYAQPISAGYVSNVDSFTKAQGGWKRIGDGEGLIPNAVTIECRRETGQCIEASIQAHGRNVYAPEFYVFDATFSSDAVVFINDLPKCVRYSVRLDLKLEKAFAVRQKKAVNEPRCSELEDRIEMQLVSVPEPNLDPAKGKFVPILAVLTGLFSLFDRS